MKKILSLVLCLCMLAGLAAPALAAEEAPAPLDISVETEAPAETEAPIETEAPAETEAPMETEAPIQTEAPVETDGTTSDAPEMEGGVVTGGFIEDTDLLWTLEDGVLTISGTGALPDYKGPQTEIDGVPAQPWAEHREEITSIQIGEGVTALGTYAFYNCTKAESVSFPASLTRLGSYAFQNCTSLKTLTLPKTITQYNHGVFANCTGLETLTIEEGVRSIGMNTFQDCTGLKTVTIPLSLNTVGSINDFAFAGCTAITDIYYGGDEDNWVACNGKRCFDESITVHFTPLPLPVSGKLTDTITWSIDEAYTLTITGTGAMPDYDTYWMTPWANYRVKVTGVVVSQGITHIGKYSFGIMDKLTSVSLPESLVSMGERAFAQNYHLTAVDLPAGLKVIGDTAFGFCNALTSIDLPDGLTTLGEGAFYLCTSLTEVTLPGSLTSIGMGAFSGCENLVTATVEEGITYLPQLCFASCTALKTLSLPFSIETVGYNFCPSMMSDSVMESITVAADPDGVYEFIGWLDGNDAAYTTADLLAGAEYSGDLVSLWQKIWNDPFTDVKTGDWFYDSVKFCYQTALMNGHTETGFYPYATATRGQVVTVLYRMAGSPDVSDLTTTFTDVSATAYYANAVVWAANAGIAKGDNATTFRPKDDVTRQEFLVFLYRFAQYMELDTTLGSAVDLAASFKDGANVPDWARDAQKWSVATGLQTGYALSDGTYLLPYNSIARCEMAAFLTRFLIAEE